jgi:hypothetical protein
MYGVVTRPYIILLVLAEGQTTILRIAPKNCAYKLEVRVLARNSHRNSHRESAMQGSPDIVPTAQFSTSSTSKRIAQNI